MNRKEAIEIIKNSNIHGARMNGKNLIIDAINELVKDITLSDLLGWEEGVEYEYKDLYVLKVENNRLFMKSEKCSSGWCNFALFTDEIKELQQAKKVEPKLKAYHVKDEYSYNELMKELEEQGYDMNFKNNPFVFEGEIYIFEEEKKELGFSIIKLNKVLEKYDLIEYHKEEPKFYAKIKGWELYYNGSVYWEYDSDDCDFVLGYKDDDGYIFKNYMTKTEWNELGINDSNAEWEEVDQ